MTEKLMCEKHGEYDVKEVVFLGRKIARTSCQACIDEQEAASKREELDRVRTAEIQRWESRIGTACIPDRFRDKTLDSYIADSDGKRKARDFAKRYAEEFDGISGKCAVFLGKPGTGKTHLSIGIALSVMRQGYTAMFMTVMRVIRRIKDTWGRGSEMSETEAIQSLVFPDLLILDEIGVQFGSDTEKMLLFEVINERYELRKPTLLLSNLSLDEVKAYLGERVFDRLREDGGEVIVFDWESQRGRQSMAVAA